VYAAWIADPAGVDAELAAAATSVVAATGDADDYEQMLARAMTGRTPQEQLRHLYSLAEFDDEALVLRTCELALTDRVRTQNAPFLLRAAIGNRRHGAAAWGSCAATGATSTSACPATRSPAWSRPSARSTDPTRSPTSRRSSRSTRSRRPRRPSSRSWNASASTPTCAPLALGQRPSPHGPGTNRRPWRVTRAEAARCRARLVPWYLRRAGFRPLRVRRA
jgi:hypothetical protein